MTPATEVQTSESHETVERNPQDSPDPTASQGLHAGFQFIIWLDQLGCDPLSVEALAYESRHGDGTVYPPPIGVGDFVIIEDPIQGRQWFGQVLTPQLNLPLFSTSRTAPTNLVALERVLDGRVSDTVFTRQVYHYQIRLLGHVEDGKLLSVRLRPRAGARGRLAIASEVIRYLDLPAVHPAGAIDWQQLVETEVSRSGADGAEGR